MTSNLFAGFRGGSRVAIACFVLLILVCGLALGQETTGSIAGQVVDSSGAAIPNAKVEVSGASLPRALATTTNSTGGFLFPALPASSYLVSVTAAGFSTQKTNAVSVTLGRVSRLEFKMEVGQVTESVVVSADAAMVDTSSSSSAVNVDKSFFDLMPKGRGFYDLINLAPGARDEKKSGGYQVDGASGSENTFYLDGMEVTDIRTGALSNQNKIPVEMVQQVQVKNGVMEAQYGGAMGGVINASVRSGTNELHGQAGFYFNNDEMAARMRPTYQMNLKDDTRTIAEYFQNPVEDIQTWNPVFSVGGPLIKNKLFYFIGYMPTHTSTIRPVTFVKDDVTQSFKSTEQQQYLTNKLDYSPFSKIRMNASWMWNPGYTRGILPARNGSDAREGDWANRGNYTAGNILSGQVDYLANSKLIVSFRGGYNFTNYTDRYAIPDATAIYYTNSNLASQLAIPNDLRAPAGWQVQAVARTDYNAYKRVNLNADASYLFNWKGQHNIKGGWQTNRLSNDVQSLTYPNGYYRYYWGQTYTCATTQCKGDKTGDFGYYRYRLYGTTGAASSDNQGIFLQDNWRVNKYLSLNLGLRSEREFLPSFATANNVAAPPVEFGWSKKVSPRIGGAWDPRGNGKMRIYASGGYFYDVMKYEMPRGSFGGDVWMDYYFALNDPNLVKTNKGVPADPKSLPGTFFESVNNRIPSNDPTNPRIDKNLKPMKQRMLDLGYDYSFTSSLTASLRYTNRRLIRTIEDVGTPTADGEAYYIANPGEGLTIDPKTWEVGTPVTPKAKRNYDALEMRLDQRFTKNFQFAASYTYSRSTGNYSGLASSDEPDSDGKGRTSPNVNRYFDEPWIGYTEKGVMADGLLATDRPHSFKLFGGYTRRSFLGNTTLAPTVSLYSGTPLTTQVNLKSTNPAYPYGRADMGRTPVFYNFDVNLMHECPVWKAKESMKVRFEFSVFNLLNSSIVTGKSQNLMHPDDNWIRFDNTADIFKGFNTVDLMKAQNKRLDPMYNMPNTFQEPRKARLQVTFFF